MSHRAAALTLLMGIVFKYAHVIDGKYSALSEEQNLSESRKSVLLCGELLFRGKLIRWRQMLIIMRIFAVYCPLLGLESAFGGDVMGGSSVA